MTIHLTAKNSLSIVQVLCMIALAIIPLVAEPSHLGWVRWLASMWIIVFIGVVSVFVQAHLQSKEDHEREQKEQRRDSVQEGILAQITQSKSDTPLVATQIDALDPSDPPVNFDALKQFKTSYQSWWTQDVEKRVKIAAAQNKSVMPAEDFYARLIGIGLVGFLHDLTWAYVWKSQILLLLELNKRGGSMPTAEAKSFYDSAAKEFPSNYARYFFEQWIGFMQAHQLVIPHQNGMLALTMRGKDFIAYSAYKSYTPDQRKY